jgi:hypothetical protein
MEATLTLLGIATALALSLAGGVALTRLGLGGLFRLLFTAESPAPGRLRPSPTFAGGALPRAPLELSPLPAGSVPSRRAQRFAGGRRR